MTALLFELSPERASFMMDTLAVTTEGEPAFFTSKFTPLPHLRTIVCGTGLAHFSTEWAFRANGYVVAGLENLDHHTPNGLNQLWSEHQERHGAALDGTTTVYQFGVSEESGEIAGFAYRSTAEFASERLPSPCVAFKPTEGVEAGIRPGESAVRFIHRMREQQERLPRNNRIYIGGAILACTIFIDGSITISEVDRFADSDEMQLSTFARLAATLG